MSSIYMLQSRKHTTMLNRVTYRCLSVVHVSHRNVLYSVALCNSKNHIFDIYFALPMLLGRFKLNFLVNCAGMSISLYILFSLQFYALYAFPSRIFVIANENSCRMGLDINNRMFAFLHRLSATLWLLHFPVHFQLLCHLLSISFRMCFYLIFPSHRTFWYQMDNNKWTLIACFCALYIKKKTYAVNQFSFSLCVCSFVIMNSI